MATDLANLPDEVADLIAPYVEGGGDAVSPPPEALDAIAQAIITRREEAKQARVASGIEQIWKEAEEAYVGIDDANRGEFSEARWSKPMSMDGPVSTDKRPREGLRSTVFVRLTSRYVDAGAAKLAEVLLPIDGLPFKLEPTLDPDLVKAREDMSQVVHDGMGNVPLTRAAKPGEVQAGPQPGMPVLQAGAPGTPPAAAAAVPAPGAAPGGGLVPAAGAAAPQAPQVPLTVKDLAEEKIELATKKAKAAEKKIGGWMQKCQRNSEVRKVIFDAARMGTGVLKGPFPVFKREMATTKGKGKNEIAVEIREVIRPASKRVDAWNVFPDPACGESIQNGDYCFERDFMTPRQVEGLKELPGYIAGEIDKLLIEGPDKCNIANDGTVKPADEIRKATKSRFEIWYYYGSLKRDEYRALIKRGKGYDPNDDKEDNDARDQVYAIVTVINDRPIRATVNPLDTGAFPYHSFPWQRREGYWAGVGVAEQMKAPQRITNAGTRAMMNNAGIASGGQIVVDRAAIRPSDGTWGITPNKIWYKTTESASTQSVDDAFHIYEIPSLVTDLMTIIEFGMKLAEESTSIPLVTQGQSGETTPETLGATQLQDSNANQLLRSIGYAFDDYISDPEVRLYYEWLLLDPEVDDDEKGDFEINAKLSASLVEQAIMDQTIQGMGQMAANPIYGIDPKRWAMQFLKSKHLNPADFQYSEQERQRMAQQPPAPPVPVQVAQINASVQRDALVMKQTAHQRTEANEQQVAAAAHALEGQRIEYDHREARADITVRLHELEVQRQTELLKYANARRISLDRAKADLARAAMTLQTQQRLNAADNATEMAKNRGRKDVHPQRTAPALEAPTGRLPRRAGNGRQFEEGPPT